MSTRSLNAESVCQTDLLVFWWPGDSQLNFYWFDLMFPLSETSRRPARGTRSWKAGSPWKVHFTFKESRKSLQSPSPAFIQILRSAQKERLSENKPQQFVTNADMFVFNFVTRNERGWLELGSWSEMGMQTAGEQVTESLVLSFLFWDFVIFKKEEPLFLVTGFHSALHFLSF